MVSRKGNTRYETSGSKRGSKGREKKNEVGALVRDMNKEREWAGLRGMNYGCRQGTRVKDRSEQE